MSWTRYTTESVMVSPVSSSRLNHSVRGTLDLMSEPRPSAFSTIWTYGGGSMMGRRHYDLGTSRAHCERHITPRGCVLDDVVEPVAAVVSSSADTLSQCGSQGLRVVGR